MPTTTHELQRIPALRPFMILVATDFTPSSASAFEQAMNIAQRVPGAALHVVHVVEPGTVRTPSRLERWVYERATAAGGGDDRELGLHRRVGDPAVEIADVAGTIGADLLVIGAHQGRSLRRAALGSVSQSVRRLAHCPVIVDEPRPAPIPRIEPLCPDCTHVRFATQGREQWCGTHSRPRLLPHVYGYRRAHEYGMHDSEVTPTGTSL
jgi:nucleotide-binding universal stress UspA family protein